MGLRMKNVNIVGIHRKICFSGGGFTKNQYRGGIAWEERGAWTVWDLSRGFPRKREGGWYPNAHYAYTKLKVKLWNNAAKNEKLFLRNNKILATDFQIKDRKISIGYWQRKSQCKSFGCNMPHLFLNFVKICGLL